MSGSGAKEAVERDIKPELREALLRAAFGSDAPPDDVHRSIVAWSGAAATNTLRAIRSDLRVIAEFQERQGRSPLPLSPAACFALIDERARLGRAKTSIDRLIASATRLHALAELPSPIDSTVRWRLREMRKLDTRERRQALGLRIKGEVSDLRADNPQLVSLLTLLDSIPNDPAGLRDRALLSCAYDAGLRRSEVVRTRVEHLTRLPNGEGSLYLPRSKTDQEGEGARVWLSLRSMEHIAKWQEVSGYTNGPLFRSLSRRVSSYQHLHEQSVGRILKRRLAAMLEPLVVREEIDRETAARVILQMSAHSLRVGCDQDLFAAGVDIGAIMQGLRWTSPRQPLAYARHLAPATSKLAAAIREVV